MLKELFNLFMHQIVNYITFNTSKLCQDYTLIKSINLFHEMIPIKKVGN